MKFSIASVTAGAFAVGALAAASPALADVTVSTSPSGCSAALARNGVSGAVLSLYCVTGSFDGVHIKVSNPRHAWTMDGQCANLVDGVQSAGDSTDISCTFAAGHNAAAIVLDGDTDPCSGAALKADVELVNRAVDAGVKALASATLDCSAPYVPELPWYPTVPGIPTIPTLPSGGGHQGGGTGGQIGGSVDGQAGDDSARARGRVTVSVRHHRRHRRRHHRHARHHRRHHHIRIHRRHRHITIKVSAAAHARVRA